MKIKDITDAYCEKQGIEDSNDVAYYMPDEVVEIVKMALKQALTEIKLDITIE